MGHIGKCGMSDLTVGEETEIPLLLEELVKEPVCYGNGYKMSVSTASPAIGAAFPTMQDWI